MALSCESPVTASKLNQVVNKAIFLDRDGVINHPFIKDGKPYPPMSLEDFVIYDDALNVMSELKQRKFLLIVVTNQPDINRGTQDIAIVNKMHQKIMGVLPVDHIEMALVEAGDDYKPKPGMLLNTAKNFDIDLAKSYMIGDRWRDIGAGINAGCYKNILLDRSYSEDMIFKPDYVCDTLTQAKNYIFEQEGML